MKRMLNRFLMTAGMVLIAGSTFASEEGGERFAVASAQRSSGGNIAVAFRDAYLLNLDRKQRPATEKQFRIAHDQLFAIDQSSVHLQIHGTGGWKSVSAYDGPEKVLGVQRGASARQLLILDATSLAIVDFGSEQATVLGRFAIDNRGAAEVGERLVERFADNVYVIDSALPGFRVINIEDVATPRELTRFATAAAPSEISISAGHVFLVVAGEVQVVAVGDFVRPEPKEHSTLRGSAAVRTVAFDGQGRGFLGDGASLHVIDANPASEAFLRIASTVHMPATIDRVLIQSGKAFVFDRTGTLEVVGSGDGGGPFLVAQE